MDTLGRGALLALFVALLTLTAVSVQGQGRASALLTGHTHTHTHSKLDHVDTSPSGGMHSEIVTLSSQ